MRLVCVLHEYMHSEYRYVYTTGVCKGRTVSIFVGFAANPKAGTDNRRKSQLQATDSKQLLSQHLPNKLSFFDNRAFRSALVMCTSTTTITPHPMTCSPSLLTKIADSSSAFE